MFALVHMLAISLVVQIVAAATFPEAGTSWPEAEERMVEGLEGAKGFVEYGSAPFLSLLNISSASTLSSATQKDGVWTSERTHKKLAALSLAVRSKWPGVALVVKRAWTPPPQDSSSNCDAKGQQVTVAPTLYNEGRAVGTFPVVRRLHTVRFSRVHSASLLLKGVKG